jgi:phage terminase large subunit
VDDGRQQPAGNDQLPAQPRLPAHPLDELTLYSYKLDKLTGQVTPVLADKDNHMIDALRYAVEGVRRIQPDKRDDSPVSIPRLATAFNR